MDIVSILITFVGLFSLTGALECYTCNDCEKNTGETATCGNIISNQILDPLCGKYISSSGVVSRRCTTGVECTTSNLNPLEDECTSGNENDCYTCCSTDLCNAATPSVITASLTFVIIATTMTMWLLK